MTYNSCRSKRIVKLTAKREEQLEQLRVGETNHQNNGNKLTAKREEQLEQLRVGETNHQNNGNKLTAKREEQLEQLRVGETNHQDSENVHPTSPVNSWRPLSPQPSPHL
ncbi:hypothetical protein EV426DRAFT_577695 [Tirmania nivea]|nr:hypothetical protein EV426DRAFT_577695 [Tirmania nivea]